MSVELNDEIYDMVGTPVADFVEEHMRRGWGDQQNAEGPVNKHVFYIPKFMDPETDDDPEWWEYVGGQLIEMNKATVSEEIEFACDIEAYLENDGSWRIVVTHESPYST